VAAGLSRHWALEIVVLLTVEIVMAFFLLGSCSKWHTGQLAERATALIQERYACRVIIPAPFLVKLLPNGPLGGPLGPEEYPSPYIYTLNDNHVIITTRH